MKGLLCYHSQSGNTALAGDAAERLTEWVPQVCIAFGWRLEYISIRPDYLQWVARVPPNTAPGYLIMGSSQPHHQNMVRSHIKQTRERQGLNQEE